MITEQEFYDRGVRGCLEQGHRSIRHGNACAFRGHGEDKCFLGHNISDELYMQELEHLDMSTVASLGGFAHIPVLLRDGGMTTHDTIPVKDWPQYFRKLAVKHGLSDAVVTEWEKEVNHD